MKQKTKTAIKFKQLTLDDRITIGIRYRDGLNFHQIAKEKKATLITTKKDWVKFPKLFQEKISYLDVELQFENKELLISELTKIL